MAKANEEKSGDRLAGLAAETAQERVAAKIVLSDITLADLLGIKQITAEGYTKDEVALIEAYRAHPELQHAVWVLLGMIK